MSCCDSSNKSKGIKGNSSIMEMVENNETKNKSGIRKLLLILLHLTILAILVLGDDVQVIESNLKYIIIGYVFLFLILLLFKPKKRIE